MGSLMNAHIPPLRNPRLLSKRPSRVEGCFRRRLAFRTLIRYLRIPVADCYHSRLCPVGVVEEDLNVEIVAKFEISKTEPHEYVDATQKDNTLMALEKQDEEGWPVERKMIPEEAQQF